MKFIEQVKSYQNALTRKSRLFGSLMLVSGIGLVAAAPFLSYEVSKIECYENGTVPSKIGENEMVIQKNDWERKDQKIEDLETEIKNKEEKINSLINDSNCDRVIEVIKNEKEELIKIRTRLEQEIVVIEKERDVCREQLMECEEDNRENDGDKLECDKIRQDLKVIIVERDRWKKQYEECEVEKEQIIGTQSDCSVVERERDRWKKQYEECELVKEELLGNQGSSDDCDKLKTRLDNCNNQLAEDKEVIAGLRRDIRSCEAASKISISSTLNYKETFTFNNEKFIVSLNLSDDPKLRYFLSHNGRDVTNRIKINPNNEEYSFSSANRRYRINFGREGKRGVNFDLSSL